MKKYLAIIPLFAVAFTLTMSPAFAGERKYKKHKKHYKPKSMIEVNNRNSASVYNKVESNANTGMNQANANGGYKKVIKKRPYGHGDYGHKKRPVIKVYGKGKGVIHTGDARSSATAYNVLNSNVTKIK